MDQDDAATAAHAELAGAKVAAAVEEAAVAAAQVEAVGVTRGDPELDELLVDIQASTAEPHGSPSPRTGHGVGDRVGGADKGTEERPSRAAKEARVKKEDECRRALSLARARIKSAEATLRQASTREAADRELTAARRQFETCTAEATLVGTSRDEAATRTAVLSAKMTKASCTRDAAVKDAEQTRDDLKDARKAAGAAAHRLSAAHNHVAEAEA